MRKNLRLTDAQTGMCKYPDKMSVSFIRI